MNTTATNNSTQNEKYTALLPISKAIVQLLAVNIDYCSPDMVLPFLKNLQCIDGEGRQPTSAALLLLVNELAAHGLLLKNSKGISCPESIRRLAFEEALFNGTFPAIVEHLQRFLRLPAKLSGKYQHQGNYQRLLRDFQISLFYHGSLEEVSDLVYHYAYNKFNDDYYENNPFLTFLNRPFSADIVEKIDPGIRLKVLANLLHAADNNLESAGDIIAYIVDKHSKEIPTNTLASAILMHYLLCGDTVKFRALLDLLGGGDLQLARLYWAGCLGVISGDFPKALAVFRQSDQLLKKLSGKKKMVLTNYSGIFQLVTQLQTDEPTALKEALDSIAFAKKNGANYPLLPLMELMMPIFQDKLGMVVSAPLTENLRYFRKNPIDIFFCQLFHFWVNGTKNTNDIPLLQQTRDKALASGYTWIAAELSALLAALGHDHKANRATAAKLHALCNTTSCVDIIKLQSPWEKVLNSLLHINKPPKDSKKEGMAIQRLIWLFSFSEQYNFYHIEPKLQKMTGKGTWTTGSPMALKRLYTEYQDMPGLSDQDRQICRTIKEEHFRSGWGGPSKATYVLDKELALPALVGHPLLFLENAREVNVELVPTEPELHFREEKGELQLTIVPSCADATGNLLVLKDTPTRFKIVRFTAEHKHVINLVGTGMTIPKSGEKLARQVVDKLSTFMAIHSDLAGASWATAVAADSRPHAHILPFRDGISLEFLVKPISTGNSSFRPGKGSKTVTAVIDGKTVQAVRDLVEEKQLLARILEACPTLSRLEAGDQWQAEDPEDSLELLLELKECGDDVVLEWPRGEKFAVRRQVSWNNFSLHIGKDHDWFKATGTLRIDDAQALDLRRLLEMLGQATGRFIPLDDGTFLALTKSLHKRLQELQAYSEGHGEGVRFAPLAALALEDFTREAGQLHSDKAWKEHCKRLTETDTPQLPSTLRADLRDYQATGFRWLARLSSWEVGACLADDMGLGKTVQALAAILLRAAKGPTLVVAPLSVTSNWLDEARRFAPTLNIIVFGPGDRNQVVDNLQAFDLLVVSYGLLPLEAALLASVQWQTVVLDEAQAIKNKQTKRSQAAMGLRAECRIITTGTPLENHLGELWTLFNFLNPGLLGSFKRFNEKYAIPIERDQDKDARNRLRKLIRPFILRRLKSDVLQELPAKTEITLEVEMSPEEQLLYEAQRQKALATIDAHKGEEAGPQHLRILAEIMKLRRLCCNPSLLLPEAGIASSKLQVFTDTLRELLDNNHKALIFSQFVDHLAIIRAYLDEEKISYQYLDGSTPIKERKERINAFQNGSGDVFLISLKAGGAGLNLTAADYVIHMDPWWNPAVEDQASDRAHRIGQDRPVTVYRLVMKDSIEQQIVGLHKQKRALADSLLEGTDAAGKISAPELLALLHGEKG